MEIIYVIFPDGESYGFYTGEGNRTVLPLYELKREYKRDIKDAYIVMHNHFATPHLSEADEALYYHLKSLGFKGSFGIYLTSSKQPLLYDEKTGRCVPYHTLYPGDN